ncbi:MAG: methyltransferase domain-containing protein [Caldilineaceae bacterium]|nr:methyltransferase domain-containing protein [Caldilineaceae bacterium]
MTPEHSPNYSKDVRAYYEQNSSWFALVGRRQHSQVIHRPVWAEGVVDRRTALNYVNERIHCQIQEILTRQHLDRVKVLDLGCGFGATIRYLQRRLGPKILAIGLTVSAKQAQIARQWVDDLGIGTSCTFLEADFHAIPLAGQMDVVFSIEAFAHAIAPERYFAEAARLLKPGARLILCDDFQTDGRSPAVLSEADRRWLAIFKSGWHVPHLLARTEVIALAQRYGLQVNGDFDLNPYLCTKTFPNLFIPLFEKAINGKGALSPFLESVLGGWALENSIRRGNVTYRFLVFEKQG